MLSQWISPTLLQVSLRLAAVPNAVLDAPSVWALRKLVSDPAPKALLQRYWLRLMEPYSDFVPRITLTQHLERFSEILAVVVLDPAFNQFDQ
jgi:hypothetical protein